MKLLTRAEEGKLLAEKVTLLDNHIALLNSRIIELEGMVKAYELVGNFNDSLITSYKAEIAIMKEQRKLFEGAIKDNEKVIRKLKRKVFWTSLGGVAGIGAMTVLLLTK